MKFNAQKISSQGNMKGVKESKMQIGDINKLLRITSLDLYSHPVRTAIQEYISNAKDAQDEVNSCLSKMEIDAPTFADQCVRIRDYGPGLSSEEIESIFSQFGVSTKDTNNKAIGGFGLGSKSWFSVAPSFSMVSIKDGIKVYCVFERDEESFGSVKFLGEEETNEPNGVELTLPLDNQDQIPEAKRAILRVIRYWKKQPKLKNLESEKLSIEKRSKDYTLFSRGSSSSNTQVRITVGTVEYGISHVNCYQTVSDKLRGLDITLHFNVGDIEVAPNRETISNNDKNNKNIERKVEQVFTELSEFYKTQMKEYKLPDLINASRDTFLSKVFGKTRFEQGVFSYDINSYSITVYKNNQPIDLHSLGSYYVLKNGKATQAQKVLEDMSYVDTIVINDVEDIKDKDLRYSLEGFLTPNEYTRRSYSGRVVGGLLAHKNSFTDSEIALLQKQYKLKKLSEIQRKCTVDRSKKEKKLLDTTNISVYYSSSAKGRTKMVYGILNKKTDRLINVSEYKSNEELREIIRSQIANHCYELGGYRYLAVSQDYYDYLTGEGFKPFTKETIENDLLEIIKEQEFCKTFEAISFLSHVCQTSVRHYSYHRSDDGIKQVMKEAKKVIQRCKDLKVSHPYVFQLEKVVNAEYKGLNYEKSQNLYDFLNKTDGYMISSQIEKMPKLKQGIDSACKKAKSELKLDVLKKFEEDYPLAFGMFQRLIVKGNNNETKLNEFKSYFNLSV